MIIWLASYPRSGNTFLRIILNSVFGIYTFSIYDDKGDIGADKKTSEIVGHKFLPDDFNLEQARSENNSYYIKTHEFPDHRVKPEDKVIYLIRDGRESSLSFYKLRKNKGRSESLEDIILGHVSFGSWGEHVNAWNPKARSNTLLIKFEELIDSPLNLIEPVKNFTNEKSIKNNIPTFDELHKINSKFFRSGKKRSWKDVYTQKEHILFWVKNYSQMHEYGYSEEPEVLKYTKNLNYFESLSKVLKKDEERFKSDIENKYGLDKAFRKGNVSFSHIINPVIVDSSSDLFIAQPVTFETMKVAQKFAAENGVAVEQYCTFFQEDEEIVPAFMKKTSKLEHSILDFDIASNQKKLPLLKDFFEKILESSDSDYIIYSNVDIALMPHFYLTIERILNEGYDVINICRRTLKSDYNCIDDIPVMYADLGENHPGTDCFVMKRSIAEKLELENIVVGAYFVALALRVNLFAFSVNIEEFKQSHMTFHIGDDRPWNNMNNVALHNANELNNIFKKLLSRNDVINYEKVHQLEEDFNQRKVLFFGNNSTA